MSVGSFTTRPAVATTEALRRTWTETAWLRRSVAARLAVVTPFGWSVAACAVAAWLIGARLGWEELDYVAAGTLAAVLLAALFTVGRAELAIDLTLAPPRVVVGERAVGEVAVRNVSGRRLIPVPIELPVGQGIATFDLPPLAGGASHDDAFIVPTHRRAVIPVGPAKSVRSDPLGLLRREIAFSDVTELFVHPRTATLDPFGSGLLRDLEGNTTDAISPSDLAFHSLRSYVPGDDRRHVHWRTTARLPSGELMVRQFLDTRRSHLVVVLDACSANYSSEDEFELAVSSAASFAICALRSDQDVTVVAGQTTLARGGGTSVLDAFSRVEMADDAPSVDRLSIFAASACRDASLIVVTTGSTQEPGSIRRAAGRFDLDATVVGLVASSGEPSSVQVATGLKVMRVGELGELVRLAAGAVKV